MKSFSNLNKYSYRSKDLLKVLVDIGFSVNEVSTRQKLLRLQDEGKFTPPRDPKNNYWHFTEDQLLEIAKSFSPGGTGEWHFDNKMQEV